MHGADIDVGDAVGSFQIASLAGHGQLFAASSDGSALSVGASVAATGNSATVYFQPDANYDGADAFTYTASDAQNVSGAPLATASISVTAVQDAFDDTLRTSEDTPGSVSVLANDTFGACAAVTGVTNGTHGIVVINNDAVTYTPVANYNGADRGYSYIGPYASSTFGFERVTASIRRLSLLFLRQRR